MQRFLKIALVFVLLTAGLARAHGYKAGDIEIQHPWSRATVEVVPTGVVYMVLRNTGTSTDRLVGVSTPVAQKAELHTHIKDGELVRMRQVEAIELVSSTSVALEPGGLHVMLIGLKQPLVKDQPFPLTLVFEEAGPVVVQVYVHAMTDLPSTQGTKPASVHTH